MPTLLLSPPFNEDSGAIWEAALDHGWQVERVEGWKVPEALRGKDIGYYGFLRPHFARMLMDSLAHTLLEPTIDWLPTLREKYRQRTIRLMTMGEARHITGPAFIKPAEDKDFPAQLYSSISELALGEDLAESLPVLMSEPVQWEVEYRCFVLERMVVTFAPYMKNGSLTQYPDGSWPPSGAESEDALAWATKLLEDPAVPLPTAVVIDIGRIKGRGWAAVEANPAWASALYGCDPAQVLRVIHRACIPY